MSFENYQEILGFITSKLFRHRRRSFRLSVFFHKHTGFDNSFAYFGDFDPGADGTLNIVLQRDLGGDDFDGLDGNPTLQGVVVHTSTIPEPSSSLLGLIGLSFLAHRRRR